jgi:hypothetical protein
MLVDNALEQKTELPDMELQRNDTIDCDRGALYSGENIFGENYTVEDYIAESGCEDHQRGSV